MSVDGVNNSSNAGLYAVSGMALGAGAGAAAGYLTKPFLKDGAPTDTFMKKMEENFLNTLDDDFKKQYAEATENVKKLDAIKSADELKEFVRNNKELKKAGMVDTLLAEIDKNGFVKSKEEMKKGVKLVIDAKDNFIIAAFDATWDGNKKEFVHNAELVTSEGFNAIKKAASSIQGKYAAIYGAIGAAVLGVVGYLCGSAGDKEQPKQATKNLNA